MSEHEPNSPNSGTPAQRADARTAPARPPGTPRDGAIPRLETVRVTAPDLARRAALETSRRRLLGAAAGFTVLFTALAAKLTDATVLNPVKPPPLPKSTPTAAARPRRASDRSRAMMVDRNGEILAVSLPTAGVYADPRQMMDRADAVRRLKGVLPDLNGPSLLAELMAPHREFVYIAREVGPEQELRINDLGIPGVYFRPAEARHYPLGRTAAQTIGAVDIDGDGIAGLEKSQNRRLREDPNPLRLALDVRVQAVLRDEMAKAVDDFQAIGAAGIVMDVRTGEVVAMVSLPDYNANDFGSAPAKARFNRAATGVYEPGSAFKLQTAGMGLDAGLIHVWDRFNTTHPIYIDGFVIRDYEPADRWLYFPEVIAYSSNIGASRIALIVGKARQRAWIRKLGFFERCPIELPEAAMPLVQTAAEWSKATVMTVSFGNGIAVTPLHLINGTVALVNGGVLFAPTLLYQDPATPRPGSAVMQPDTSRTVRLLMRDVVAHGTGIFGRVPGYFVGGKTGTSQVVHDGSYRHHTNLAGFLAAFPINAPRYALYVMLDAPHANALSQGYSTGGEISAPVVARTIARIAPMFGLLPVTDHAEKAAIEKEINLPLRPAAPPGVIALGPGHPYPPGAADAPDDLSRARMPAKGRRSPATRAPRRYASSHAADQGR
ncbi:MAG: peptidoglycan D,D-transpeptidase FtsI family protein [Acetobacteraceae bacterium]